MFLASVVLFFLAAAFGLTLLFLSLAKKPLLLPVVISHGMLASSGLTLLIAGVLIYCAQDLAIVSLGLFLIAAAGGLLLLLVFHLKGKHLPLPLVLLHGLVAVMGELLLIIYIFKRA